MSPLMPAAGSKIAKRPSDIDLQYACSGDPRQTGELVLQIPGFEVVEDAFGLALRKARNRGQLGN
jgi:hypothetical protein